MDIYILLNSLLLSITWTLLPPDLKLSIRLLLPFMINTLLFYMTLNILTIRGSKIPTRVFITISTVVSVSAIIKYKFQKDYIYYWDLILARDAVRVANYFKGDIMSINLILYLLFAGIIFIAIDNITETNRKTIKSQVLSIIVITGLISTTGLSYGLEQTYENKGKILGFIHSINVSREINQFKQEARNLTTPNLPNIPEPAPIIDTDNLDIVVIQSETFFDIMKLSKTDNVKISKDITEHFRRYQREGIGGEVYVPVIGGLTCNPEFEFLTGIPTRIFPRGSIVYTGYLKEETDSIAWQLKDKGFKTTAIHNYEREFWERYRVYPLLGFNEYISMESFVKPKKYGHWIADEEIFKKTLQVLDSNKDNNNFVFSVTVQNHGPFAYHSVANTLNVSGFPKDDEISMRNFASGLRLSDIALRDFMETLRKREKPTLVVFYGDHLPSRDHKFYEEFKFFTEDTDNMYNSDYFIWYSKEGVLDNETKDTSLIALSAKVRELIGVSSNTSRYTYRNFSGENKKEYFNLEYGKGTPFTSEVFSLFNNRK